MDPVWGREGSSPPSQKLDWRQRGRRRRRREGGKDEEKKKKVWRRREKKEGVPLDSKPASASDCIRESAI